MGAHNGNLMSIFSCSILLCSLLLVMEVLFMSQNIHGMLYSLTATDAFFLQLLAACCELNLPRSQKIHHVFFVEASRETSFLGLVEVGDRSQTALFRSGQYNYHWIHHHLSHN